MSLQKKLKSKKRKTGQDEGTGETGLVRQTEQTDQTKQAEQAEAIKTVEVGEYGKIPPWQGKFDRLWNILQDTYRKYPSSSPEIYDLVSQLTEIVEEHFSEEEKKAYRRALLMRDVVNPNAISRHLCAENFEAIRKEAFLNEAQELREFMALENVFGVSIKDIVKYIENDAFENIKHEVKKEDGSTDRFFNWDYAANGDPDQEFLAKGSLTLKELLENNFPRLKEIPKFVSDSLIAFVIVSELRYHKFYPYYNYYQSSPVNGMNAEALLPWGIPGYLGYKAASITKIPGYNSILMLTRFPSNKDLFKKPKTAGEEGYVDVSFEKNWARGRFKRQELVENRVDTFEGDLMTPIGNSKKKRFLDALENRKTMMEVRNALCWMFSPDTEFGFVELNPDMQLLPSPWDVIRGEWRGQEIRITLDDLFEVYEQFDQFAKEIDNTPVVSSPMQAMTYLSELISNTSKYKVIFTKLNIDKDPKKSDFNPAFKELRELVQLMYMFYIKKLFDQYIKLPKMKGLSYALTPKHVLFAQEVIAEVESDKTLPGFIRDFIIENMRQVDLVPTGKWGVIFYPPVVEDDTPLFIKYQQKIGGDFAITFNRWLKPAKREEKDPNQ